MEWAKYKTKSTNPAEDEEEAGFDGLPPDPENIDDKGVVPKVIRTIINRRVQVKQLLKQETDVGKKQQLDIRQKALKLTANSLYGCLGFSSSRFHAQPIAALVTAKGRQILQRTVDLAENNMGLEVIYGDTDSIMIDTKCTDLKEVNEIGKKVVNECNKLYRTLELEMDGVFKTMLLLKKKKYAALVVNEAKDGTVTLTKEMKGLDLVRRDWCGLSKTTGEIILDRILSGEPKEVVVKAIHDCLETLAVRMRTGEVEVEEYIITKGLNKSIKDYPDAKSQPHLQVAKRMLTEGKMVNTGDHIPFVICNRVAQGGVAASSTAATGEGDKGEAKDGEKKTEAVQPSIQASDPLPYAERAYHPNEVARSQGKLVVDVEWYLTQQILPPIDRLCEPIDGTSTAELAERLGLDRSKFHHRRTEGDSSRDLCAYVPMCQMEDSDRFKGTRNLDITCTKCAVKSAFPGVVNWEKNQSGLLCPNCGVEYWGAGNAASCFARLSNVYCLQVREDKKRYYKGTLKCDDSSCKTETQQQSIIGNICLSRGCQGRLQPEFSEKDLYTQLKFYQSLFDVTRKRTRDSTESPLQFPGDKEHSYEKVMDLMSQLTSREVENSKYNWVPFKFFEAAFGGAKDKKSVIG